MRKSLLLLTAAVSMLASPLAAQLRDRADQAAALRGSAALEESSVPGGEAAKPSLESFMDLVEVSYDVALDKLPTLAAELMVRSIQGTMVRARGRYAFYVDGELMEDGYFDTLADGFERMAREFVVEGTPTSACAVVSGQILSIYYEGQVLAPLWSDHCFIYSDPRQLELPGGGATVNLRAEPVGTDSAGFQRRTAASPIQIDFQVDASKLPSVEANLDISTLLGVDARASGSYRLMLDGIEQQRGYFDTVEIANNNFNLQVETQQAPSSVCIAIEGELVGFSTGLRERLQEQSCYLFSSDRELAY